jgi:hypothetical protein
MDDYNALLEEYNQLIPELNRYRLICSVEGLWIRIFPCPEPDCESFSYYMPDVPGPINERSFGKIIHCFGVSSDDGCLSEEYDNSGHACVEHVQKHLTKVSDKYYCKRCLDNHGENSP